MARHLDVLGSSHRSRHRHLAEARITWALEVTAGVLAGVATPMLHWSLPVPGARRARCPTPVRHLAALPAGVSLPPTGTVPAGTPVVPSGALPVSDVA